MPRAKPSALTGTAELNAMIERVAPAILELLADGVPRTKPAIVAALAGRHAEDDVALALVRLAVTGEVEETGGKYALGTGDGPEAEPGSGEPEAGEADGGDQPGRGQDAPGIRALHPRFGRVEPHHVTHPGLRRGRTSSTARGRRLCCPSHPLSIASARSSRIAS